jgi:hypothetical protein
MKQTKKLLGEYSNIQIKKNVFLFKICVGLLLIINCILYIFTLIFKHSITNIINHNKFLISQTLYLKNNETLTNLKTNKYLVNLLNKTKNRKLYFTTIFNNKTEFDSLINTINYQSLNDYVMIPTLCFKSSENGDLTESFRDNCRYDDLIFVIKTKNNNRFGGYISVNKWNIQNEIDIDYVKCSNCFLFNLDTNTKYYILYGNNEKAIGFKKNAFIIFGEEDLIINEGFYSEKKCMSKFPKAYGSSNTNITKYELTKGEEYFEISELEIYGLFSYITSSD